MIAGFITTRSATVCRRCSVERRDLQIAHVLPVEEAAGQACSYCGTSLVPFIAASKPTMVGRKP